MKRNLYRAALGISILSLNVACQNGANNNPNGGMTSEQAIARIAEMQNRAQSAASAFQQNHSASDATYNTVRAKYKDAAAKNHGYLAAVEAGIVQRQKNFDTPSYHAIATDAANAQKEFVDLAEKNTPGPTKAAAFGIGIGAIADLLIKAGIAIWEEHQKDEAAKAQAVVAILKQSEWPSWESLGTASGTTKKTKAAQPKKTQNQ